MYFRIKITFALLSICFILKPNNLFAQVLGSWNVLNFKYKSSEHVSFFAEGQIRSLKFYNHFHYHELKTGITFKFYENAYFTIAGGNYQTYKEGGNFVHPKNSNEIRLWPQLILNQKIRSFKVEQRYRMEMRFTSQGYRNRFRYRFGISREIGKNFPENKKLSITFNNELFFTNKEPYFERNRMFIGFNKQLNKNCFLTCGFLKQFDYKINDETGQDFFLIGYNYELKRKEK
jgi:hypothetical protein